MDLPSSPIRWGILGTGRIACEFATGLRFLPDAQLLAVGSRTPESAQAFAQVHPVQKTYSSYQALVEDAEIDVIYVATPHFRHQQDCLLCLNAGKAVLCEKPFAMNAREAREIVATARRQQVFCMEAMWMRFMPLIQRVQQLIEDGEIGEVLALTAAFGYPTEFDPNSCFFSLERGGGALLDRGVYPLSLAFKLLGDPLTVTGQACLGKTGVDEQSALILTYPGGKLAQLSATLRGYASNTAVITGTKGKITIHPPFCRPDRISITPLSDQPVVLSSRSPAAAVSPQAIVSLQKFPPASSNQPAAALAQDTAPPPKVKPQLQAIAQKLALAHAVSKDQQEETQVISEPISGNGFNYEAMEVMQCLRQNQLESHHMPLDESVKILEVMDKLRQEWGLRYPMELTSVEH